MASRGKTPFTPVGGRAAHDSSLVAAGEWREFPLYGNGRKYEENCARCPATAATMELVAPAMQLAFAGGGETLFSTLKPGTHLRPHCGSTNTRLTCHLPLICPSGCSIRCGDEERPYREGELIFFDDSFEHEVWQRNKKESVRVVLLIRFWHPDIPPNRYPEVHHHMRKSYLEHKRRILVPPLEKPSKQDALPPAMTGVQV